MTYSSGFGSIETSQGITPQHGGDLALYTLYEAPVVQKNSSNNRSALRILLRTAFVLVCVFVQRTAGIIYTQD